MGQISRMTDSAFHRAPATVLKNIVSDAIQLHASDIHLESIGEGLRCRFRIDGMLEDHLSIPLHLRPAMISHIKVMADLDIAEKRRPQDGKIKFPYNDREIDIRVSIIPAIHGEKLVLRLLDSNNEVFSINSLLLPSEQEKVLLQLINSKQGIIIVTGPTGSGKTTTLYAILNQINKTNINIITVEDPIEYEIKGISQTQVHPAINFTFANALRAFLRQDPDVIFIGEIRDMETAQIAIRAALTGHLVLSTLHTNSAIEAVTRLLDMGIAPFLLAASLRLIIAQRLVRTFCPACKGNSDSESESCPNCLGKGYKGRRGIFELIPISQSIKELIHAGAPHQEYEKLPGMNTRLTMKEFGTQLIKNGITSEEEVHRVLF